MSGVAGAAKAALRKEMKQRIAAISLDDRRRQSSLVAKKVLESTLFNKSQRVCLYLSMEDEVSTMEIMKEVLTSGKQCFVPRYTTTSMEMLRLYSYEDYENLPLTKWNIKQPGDADNREEALSDSVGGPDLILVPGLAFTSQGCRLGRGKGYYDVYLKKCYDKPNPPVSIALAFLEQIVDYIPTNDYDLPVQHVFSCSSKHD